MGGRLSAESEKTKVGAIGLTCSVAKSVRQPGIRFLIEPVRASPHASTARESKIVGLCQAALCCASCAVDTPFAAAIISTESPCALGESDGRREVVAIG